MKTIRRFAVKSQDFEPLKKKIEQRITRAYATENPDVHGLCWLMPEKSWDDGKGYKKVAWSGASLYVHRAMYEIAVGPIPQGYVLDHLCRVRQCCNPQHAEPVSVKENTDRGLGKLKQFRRQNAEELSGAGRGRSGAVPQDNPDKR